MRDQSIKADGGKPRISLVPTEIIRAIARVMEYIVNKYGDRESWRMVEPERYRDALLRNVFLWMENPHGKDLEGGIRHIEHIACNVAFLLEVEKNGDCRIKSDGGKPVIPLAPTEIIWAIARVREYGVNKYGNKEAWRKVEPERYRDALLRHVLLWMENPHGNDAESGLPHIEHIACNVAFLLEVDKKGDRCDTN